MIIQRTIFVGPITATVGSYNKPHPIPPYLLLDSYVVVPIPILHHQTK